MDFVQFSEKARQVVVDYKKKSHRTKDNLEFKDTTIVWFCKTLANWKALVITNLNDDEYYEVTYNGFKNEIYLDCYQKYHNEAIKVD